jgi:hypothetical protein
MSAQLALIEALEAEGLSAEAIIRVLKASARKADNTNAERQARHRAKRNGSNALRNAVIPPNEYISNPPLPPVSNETGSPAEPKTAEIEQAVEFWNETADRHGLPKVKGRLSGQRRQRLKARLAENGMAGVREAIEAIGKSPFCRGETSDFRADLGFLTRPDNFAKLIEGGFAPRPQSTAPPGRRNEPLDYFEHLRSQREAAQ